MLTLWNLENLPTAGRLRIFSEKLKEIVKCFFHFEGKSRKSNTYISRTHSIFFPFINSNETGRRDSHRSGDRKMLQKQAIKLVQPSKDQFLSTFFLVVENRPVINWKKLNRNIPCEHFKIDGIASPGKEGQNYFTISIILKEKSVAIKGWHRC